MNKEIKKLIEPKLYEAFIELAKNDIVLDQVLKHTDSLSDFINALIACSVCLVDREKSFQDVLVQILKTNPECQKILELKNDSFMLSRETKRQEHISD